MCGYENLCEQPYTSGYSHFGSLCNFPCSENYNCCRTLALGIDPGKLIATDLSISFGELENMYNETDSIKESSTAYSHLPVIATCDREIIFRENVQFIPVMSLDTKLDYRNIYCARCNGELCILDAYVFTTDCCTVLE